MVHNVVRRGAALRRLSLVLLRKNGQLLASFMHSLNWLHLRLLFWCILHSLGLLATLIEVVFEVGVHEYAIVGDSAERRVLRNFARVLAADLVGRVEPNLLLRYFAQILAVEMPLLLFFKVIVQAYEVACYLLHFLQILQVSLDLGVTAAWNGRSWQFLPC